VRCQVYHTMHAFSWDLTLRLPTPIRARPAGHVLNELAESEDTEGQNAEEVHVNRSVPSGGEYANEPVRFAPLTVVDIDAESAAVTVAYRNQVLCQVNTSCLRLAVIDGEYPWHQHPRSDELFLVVEGTLEIDLADGRRLRLHRWQSVVVPAGTVHRTRGIGRTVNLCFEDLAADTIFVDQRD
jgi:mannose-6-phosphate isomerase-like protein (cupin superfamily)